ncbi:MAG: SGNH/GDSL hydrolase family protein [Bacteroidales bacterium]|nr:SGNH/GDSL hydrolase family protein [Bacteroidales bacterium]MCI2121090.1 SGNH/GDSL hydrolase family protein [Bacteroidales bacterium]MCI2144905.1 SGNH/GDSL hydrolase family protein [Bacteroidales bacterium]
MKKIIAVTAILLLALTSVKAQPASELKYFGPEHFTIINRAFGDTPTPYSRLPKSLDPASEAYAASYSGVSDSVNVVGGNSSAVAPEQAGNTNPSRRLTKADSLMKCVWNLGMNSAGIAVRFSSDAHVIGFRWTLLNDFHMTHMAGTGVRGVDLYTYDRGSKSWKFVGTAFPKGKNSVGVAVSDMRGDVREYLAYLPLYDGVESLEIGVDSGSVVTNPLDGMMIPGDKNTRKPYVFYGTSITQGGCVSRPGMAYPAIIGRRVNCESYNFGFSGNGKMNPEILQAINGIDASAFVIDCLPNCTPEIIDERAYDFIGTLAKSHPKTPVYMVENIQFPPALVNIGDDSLIILKNRKWSGIYDRFRKEGVKNVRYISARNLIGTDGEATVDGVHLTDLGATRMADGMMHVMGLNYFIPGNGHKQSPWTDVIISLGIIVLLFLASKIKWKQ